MWANFKKLSKKVNYRNGAWFFFGVAMASFRIDAIDGYTYGRLQELTEHCKLLKNLSW